jgi:hypothetical protein
MGTKRAFLVLVLLSLSHNAGAGLIGYWAFEEGTGTVAKDSSGNGHDGQLLGAPQWVAGNVGGALKFDGAQSKIDIPYWPEVTPTEGTTMCSWVFPTDTTRSCIVGQFEGYGMALMTGLYLKSVIWGSDWVLDTTIPQGEWSYIVMTWDVANKQRKVYLDGQLAGERADSTVPAVRNNLGIGLWIGWPDAWGDDSFAGLLDEVRLYNRVLTAGQVEDLFRGIAPDFLKAQAPDPANGAIGVAMPLLRWSKGETAMLHNLYLGTSPSLTDADLKVSRQPLTMYYHVQGLQPGATYYWRVDEIEKDGVTIHTGSVWSFVAQAPTAYYPGPADKANDVPAGVTLTWMPGVGAVKHHVYFGANLDAVTQGATEADKGELAETAFAPGPLEPLATYYWRVDEVLTAGVKTGPVWSFTTTLSVDDFESYTDDEGRRIYETWIDGWTNGTGATVGYAQAPFAEQKIVRGGKQSMPLDFNNIQTPFHSEAEREFAPTQDWTADGASTLILYVRGKAANGSTPVYVRLEDAAKKTATVVHPDPAFCAVTQWTPWEIPLTDFAGVNLAKVKKLCIGAGDQADPKAGGTGLIFIDDICIAR